MGYADIGSGAWIHRKRGIGTQADEHGVHRSGHGNHDVTYVNRVRHGDKVVEHRNSVWGMGTGLDMGA